MRIPAWGTASVRGRPPSIRRAPAIFTRLWSTRCSLHLGGRLGDDTVGRAAVRGPSCSGFRCSGLYVFGRLDRILRRYHFRLSRGPVRRPGFACLGLQAKFSRWLVPRAWGIDQALAHVPCSDTNALKPPCPAISGSRGGTRVIIRDWRSYRICSTPWDSARNGDLTCGPLQLSHVL